MFESSVTVFACKGLNNIFRSACLHLRRNCISFFIHWYLSNIAGFTPDRVKAYLQANQHFLEEVVLELVDVRMLQQWVNKKSKRTPDHGKHASQLANEINRGNLPSCTECGHRPVLAFWSDNINTILIYNASFSLYLDNDTQGTSKLQNMVSVTVT